jgi:hypothetical protein
MSEIRINKFNNFTPQTSDKKGGKKGDTPEEEILKKPEVNYKKADDVLDYMANSASLEILSIKTKKPINVNNHVSPESAERIAAVMKTFEETILKSAEIAISEFGLDEDSAHDVAILAFGQKHLF